MTIKMDTPLTVTDVTPIDECPAETTGGVIIDHATVNVPPEEQEGVVTMFSKYAPNDLISEEVLEKELKVTDRTIRRMEQDGRLPPALPLPGKLRHVGRLREWILTRAQKEEERVLARLERMDDLKG